MATVLVTVTSKYYFQVFNIFVTQLKVMVGYFY